MSAAGGKHGEVKDRARGKRGRAGTHIGPFQRSLGQSCAAAGHPCTNSYSCLPERGVLALNPQYPMNNVVHLPPVCQNKQVPMGDEGGGLVQIVLVE